MRGYIFGSSHFYKKNCDISRNLCYLQRLADTLDADVRRWSSGKEGKLRALLSTLQYVRLCLTFIHKRLCSALH